MRSIKYKYFINDSVSKWLQHESRWPRDSGRDGYDDSEPWRRRLVYIIGVQWMHRLQKKQWTWPSFFFFISNWLGFIKSSEWYNREKLHYHPMWFSYYMHPWRLIDSIKEVRSLSPEGSLCTSLNIVLIWVSRAVTSCKNSKVRSVFHPPFRAPHNYRTSTG